MKTIEKYIPKRTDATPDELREAERIVLDICEAFSANFQNSEKDLAHMITDKFTLRSP